MSKTKHTPANYWGPDRCQCDYCVRGRVAVDAAAAFARGVIEGLRIVAVPADKP